MENTISTLRLNALLDRLAPLRHKPYRFVFAVSAAVAALCVTALTQWIFGTTEVLLFAAGVVVCTGFFGLLAGLCTALFAACTLDFFYLPPTLAFSFDMRTWRIAAALSVLAICTHIIERRLSARVRSQIKPPLGVHGNLDGIESGELYGWAFDADHPNEPVMVEVFIDKRPVASVAAVYYRPDVAAGMGCSGSHGFYVDLAGLVASEKDALVDVRLPNGAHVGNAPAVLRLPRIERRANRPTVLFMHIPKTAGTSFREAITANFVQSEIAYLYPLAGFLVSDLRALPLEQRRAYKLVVGHFQYGMHEALPQISEYITIVREPIARVRSQYHYMRRHRPQLLHSAKGKLLGLEEVLAKQPTTDFDNTLVRCFSGVDEREFPPGTLNQEIYERAVENLRNRFAFVGHQEESDRAFGCLQRRYGWYKVSQLSPVNLGTEGGDASEDDAEANVIRDYNSWDCLLYQEILRLFPRGETAASADGQPGRAWAARG